MARLKVQLRGGFSDRNGIKSENRAIQTVNFDMRTRTALVNMMLASFRLYKAGVHIQQVNSLIINLLADVYVQEIDYNTRYDADIIMDEIVCETIREDDYDDVLTVIEYLVTSFEKHIPSESFAEGFNFVFEKEYVGYRFVDSIITPITDDNEITAIREALTSPYGEVNRHIEKSLGFLSDRANPDYANSIKESISAVERMCSLIIGKSTTLGVALDKLEKNGLQIHPAMKSAFDKLYGYTSDGSGIRHSGQLGGVNSSFEEAKFMLISCCAFVNYLKGVWAKYHN